jgi:hypothetical protein
MRRVALLFLGIGSPLLLVALLVGGESAGVFFALLSLLFPVAICVAGAARGAGGTAWRRVLPAVGFVLLVSGAGLLFLDALGDRGLRILGLPPSTVLMVAGLGLLPLLLTGFGCAGERGERQAETGRRGETD